MGYVIAVAGKGGTGKTTIAALLVNLLKEKKIGSVLAIDADPNSNLAEALGLETGQTIGKILDDISSNPDTIPKSMSKDRFIEYQVQSAIQETGGFDCLTMGRPEGPGCYCYVNNVLRNTMLKLIKDYDYIIIDNEAGLEHLSRRTTRICDTLLVVSNATLPGLKAAKRIRDITKELELKTKKNLLIINCSNQKIEDEKIKKIGLDYLCNIPLDEQITKISLNGDSLINLDKHCESISILRKIGDKIWQSS
ncbi:MAG: AAA family ATPase [Candidatus Omnitrophota bacterium]